MRTIVELKEQFSWKTLHYLGQHSAKLAIDCDTPVSIFAVNGISPELKVSKTIQQVHQVKATLPRDISSTDQRCKLANAVAYGYVRVHPDVLEKIVK